MSVWGQVQESVGAQGSQRYQSDLPGVIELPELGVEINLGPLEWKYQFLTTEPSFQPQPLVLKVT